MILADKKRGKKEDVEFHNIVGKVTDKVINEKNSGKGPEGFFYIDGEKYTCWSKTYWETFNKGDEVKLGFVIKENEFNGKVFQNQNITFMAPKELEGGFSKSQKEILKDSGVKVDKLSDPLPVIKSSNGVIKLMGVAYRIKDIELEIIKEEE
jgi:hypothetical protein